ncbi:MAG: hypothetical protein RLZZ69_108 [Cyanobacteriota bacterium]
MGTKSSVSSVNNELTTNSLNPQIRILIVDDQKMIREGLKALVKTEDDLEIVGVAENGEHAINQVESLNPSVVLMDMEMPGMNGIDATKIICQKFPDVKVLVLSTFDNQEYVSKSLNSGAMGYLLKGTPAKELTDAIRSIHRGYAQIGPGIYRNLALPQTEDTEKLPLMSPLATRITDTTTTTTPTTTTTEKSYPPGQLVTSRVSSDDAALVKRKSTSIETRKFEQTVILRPSPKWSRFTMACIMGVTAFTLIWAKFAKIEQVIPTQGMIQPIGKTQEIQVPTNGVVKEVRVEEGDRVEEGEVLMVLDTTTSKAQVNSLTQVRKTLKQENKFYRALLAGKVNANNFNSTIATLKIPSEVASLSRNRAELQAENALLNNLLNGSKGNFDPDQLARLEASRADLTERTTSARLEVQQLEKQSEQNDIQLQDTRAQLETGRQNLQEIINRNLESKKQAEDSIKIERETLASMMPVYKAGGVAKYQVNQQKQKINDRNASMVNASKQGNLERERQEQDITTLQAEINRLLQEGERLSLDISQAQQQLSNTTSVSKKDFYDQRASNRIKLSEIDSQLNKTIVENDKQIAEIDSQVAGAEQNLRYQTIVAPITGDVFDLTAYPGYVPPAGQAAKPVLQIVPTEDLVAEVFVTTDKIGFVEKGMPVDVRISAFDFGEYGGIDGKVQFISASSLEPEPPYDFFRYAVKVNLDQDYLMVDGEKKYIRPGMEVQANVKIDEHRTVWNLMTDEFIGGIEKFKGLK